ncbi:MAG: hypothetical protein ACXQTA_03295 [Candidatus Syntropharchaeales archaeon]
MYRSLYHEEGGVSVVVGALLLVLITVIAASGLALMVSEMQKEGMVRESHIASVENEMLEIPGIDPEYNSTDRDYWGSINITILNMNVEDAYVRGICINDKYANLTRRILIPAAGSKDISLNFSTNFTQIFNISVNKPITIKLTTSLANTFEHTFIPPTPVMKTEIEMEDLGIANRAVLVLDGSDSFDDGSIRGWNWTIATDDNKSIFTGKIVRVIFNSTGPFKIQLTVEDDTGMRGISKNVTIPANPNFNPPTKLYTNKTSYNQGNKIYVWANESWNKPVGGVLVKFTVISGNITLNSFSTVTSTGYDANVTISDVSASGTILIESGRLIPIYVNVNK